MQWKSYSFACRNDIGTRAEQQDAVATLATDEIFAAAVCDGMGGMEGGSLASRCATDALIETIRERDPNESVPQMYLRSIDILDERVASFTNDVGDKLNAGTTVVSVYITHDELFWMSVGDSRLYILRGGDMVQATRDHNYFLTLRSMEDSFVPTQTDLEKGDHLISFIGMSGVEIMDISSNPMPLLPGDQLLLTSDGLFKALTDDRIQEILSENADVEQAADLLLQQAQRAAPDVRDNTSFILIRKQSAPVQTAAEMINNINITEGKETHEAD